MKAAITLRRDASDPPASEAGMGLVELVIAVSVLAVVMLGLGAVMSTSLTLTGNNRARVVAANIASEEMEIARSVDFTSLQPGEETLPAEVDGVRYTVLRSIDWVDQSTGEAGACAADSSRDFLRVSVAVTWPEMRAKPVRSQTVIAPSKGAFNTDLGNIAVQVLDGEGKSAVGRRVQLSGGLTTSPVKVVPESGCVFFSGLKPAGTYEVRLTDSGYVDGQGVETPQEGPITVSAGATQSIAMLSGVPQTLEVALSAPAGHVAPSDLPLTVANPALQPSQTVGVAGVGITRTLKLFPWPGGYAVWAGDCRDADPAGRQANGTAYYTGGARPTAVSPPGPATVNLAPVTLTVMGRSSSWSSNYNIPQKGATVYAVHNDPGACPAGGTPRRYLAGTTGDNGVLLTSLPFGLWRFEVQGRGVQGTDPSTLPRVAPGSTNNFTVRVS